MSDDLATWLLAAIDEEERVARETGDDPVDSEHQARWTPARVLAECEAKRRIIGTLRDEGGDRLFADIFRLLALPLADRPGYREEWKPS